MTHPAQRQRHIQARVVGALVAAGLVVAVVRGSGQAAMVVVLVGVLVAGYAVRHRVRARHLYEKPAVSTRTGAPTRDG